MVAGGQRQSAPSVEMTLWWRGKSASRRLGRLVGSACGLEGATAPAEDKVKQNENQDEVEAAAAVVAEAGAGVGATAADEQNENDKDDNHAAECSTWRRPVVLRRIWGGSGGEFFALAARDDVVDSPVVQRGEGDAADGVDGGGLACGAAEPTLQGRRAQPGVISGMRHGARQA